MFHAGDHSKPTTRTKMTAGNFLLGIEIEGPLTAFEVGPLTALKYLFTTHHLSCITDKILEPKHPSSL